MELLLTRQLAAEPQTWQALVHPGRKIGVGEVITIAGAKRDFKPK